MSKFKILVIIVIASVIALAVQILFGNFLSARLGTLPGLRNWNLFNPRAPIVVTNKETVRVSDANDAVETANAFKSKLAVVVYYDGTGANSKLVLSGGAINWTSDGYFVSTKSAMPVPNKTYAVILSNGDIFPIKSVAIDTATNLVMLATDARNLSTAEPVISSELRPGEKILLLLNSVGENKSTFLESHLRSFAADVSGQELNSDRDQRALSIQSVGVLAPGQAAVDLDGKLAGMWDGTSVVTSDAIGTFAGNFFRDSKQVVRPGFGFNFKQLTMSEARALQLTPGAQVTQVTVGGPAAASGLLKGDIITAVNNKKIETDSLLQAMFSALKPGEPVTLEVMRNNEKQPIVITPKQL